MTGRDVALLAASGDVKRVKNTMPWLTDVEPFPFLMTEGYPILEKKMKERERNGV